ncbi:MAG: V-type ATP synthase subunit F [Thermoplasmatota archaeon]
MGGEIIKIVALCDFDTAVGLRLAGIHDSYIVSDNPRKEFDDIKSRNDIGVLLVTEKIVQLLGVELKDYRLIHAIPIIVEIPDKKGRIKNHTDFVSHLVKKAVGITINKQTDGGMKIDGK